MSAEHACAVRAWSGRIGVLAAMLLAAAARAQTADTNQDGLSLTPNFNPPPVARRVAYDYPDKKLFDQPFGPGASMTLRENMIRLAQPDFDAESFVNSPLGEGIARISRNYMLYADEMDPAVLDFWEHYQKGLKKELHDAANADRKWASYVPLSAYRKGNEHRRYPVVFVMHGFGQSIFAAEAFGYAHLAASEEFIVIIPTLRSYPMISEILQQIEQSYPVDTSRIYCAGFSGGSFATIGLAMNHPRLFAAITLGGAYFGTHDLRDPEPTAAQLDLARKYRIPAVNIVGTQDANWYPITQDGTQGFMATSKVKMDGLNAWFRINGYGDRHVSYESSQKLGDLSTNTVESKLGVKLDATRIVRTDTRYYIGDLRNEEGQDLLRIVLAQDMPHHTSAGLSGQAWDFMRQFSRDPKTGKLHCFSVRH